MLERLRYDERHPYPGGDCMSDDIKRWLRDVIADAPQLEPGQPRALIPTGDVLAALAVADGCIRDAQAERDKAFADRDATILDRTKQQEQATQLLNDSITLRREHAEMLALLRDGVMVSEHGEARGVFHTSSSEERCLHCRMQALLDRIDGKVKP